MASEPRQPPAAMAIVERLPRWASVTGSPSTAPATSRPQASSPARTRTPSNERPWCVQPTVPTRRCSCSAISWRPTVSLTVSFAQPSQASCTSMLSPAKSLRVFASSPQRRTSWMENSAVTGPLSAETPMRARCAMNAPEVVFEPSSTSLNSARGRICAWTSTVVGGGSAAQDMVHSRAVSMGPPPLAYARTVPIVVRVEARFQRRLGAFDTPVRAVRPDRLLRPLRRLDQGIAGPDTLECDVCRSRRDGTMSAATTRGQIGGCGVPRAGSGAGWTRGASSSSIVRWGHG
jgi:hypothetical protein